MESHEIIDIIPELATFFIPGYVGYVLFRAMTHIRNTRGYAAVVSCVYSIIVLSAVRALIPIDSVYAQVVITTFLCAVLAAIGAMATKSKRLSAIMAKSVNYVFAPTAWHDVIDLRGGSMIRAKLKGDERLYVGTVYCMGELPNDPWISLNNYYIYNNKDSEAPFYDQDGTGYKLMLNVNDFEFAEIWDKKLPEGSI